MEGGLNFEELNRIYREEKKVQELTKLEKDFYESLSKYLSKLASDRDGSEKTNGPDAPATVMLRDELKQATRRAKDITDTRLKKLIDIARIEIYGGKTDTKNMLPKEAEIKNRLVGELRDWLRAVISEDIAQPKNDAQVQAQVTPASLEKPIAEPARKQADVMVVAVLADIPSFAGPDRNYSLKKGDVVTLPANIGQILCKSKKARQIM